MTRGVLVLLFLLAAAGCAASDPADVTLSADQAQVAEVLSSLGGEWRWLASQGGIGGWLRTPESEGYTVVLRYDDVGNVRALRNDSLVDVSRYLAVAPPNGTKEGGIWVRYDPPLGVFGFGQLELHEIRITGKVNLVFSEPCCDRYEHTFGTTAPVR